MTSINVTHLMVLLWVMIALSVSYIRNTLKAMDIDSVENNGSYLAAALNDTS